MTLDEARGLSVIECVLGSQAYGTATPESDVDIRGIFRLPQSDFLCLDQPCQQVSDETNDVVFYELRRFFHLAVKCNPSLVELMWTPPDCIKSIGPTGQALIDNRRLFITKKAYSTFAAYAHAQIQRAKGQQKWINRKGCGVRPDKMKFCWFIESDESFCHGSIPITDLVAKGIFPCRPKPLYEPDGSKMVDWPKLEECHAARLEHAPDIYRLYHYGPGAKGVFRGPDQQFEIESIPKEDEWRHCVGLLIWNAPAYEAAMRDHKNYLTWMKERNPARYRAQEKGELDYDAKSMLHCLRLLWSGRNILENGEPIVRFTGEKLQFLRDIRAGKFSYEELLAKAQKEKDELHELKEKSALPEKPDKKAIDRLYRELAST